MCKLPKSGRERPEKGFGFAIDPIALQRFFHGKGADLGGEPSLGVIGEGGVILQGKSGGKVPALHHEKVVFLAFDGGNAGEMIGVKGVAQIKGEKKADPQTAGVEGGGAKKGFHEG